MEPGFQSPRISTWLDVRPSLRVSWLKWRNTVRRWPLAAAIVVLSLFVLGTLTSVSIGAPASTALVGSPFIVFTFTVGMITVIILRRRRRLASARHHDWLAALPSDLSLTAQAAVAPLTAWVGAVLVAAGIATRPSLSALARLVLASAIGYLAAIVVVVLVVAIGTKRARRSQYGNVAPRSESQPSRYAVVRRVRRDWATNPRLSPLGYWPVAQTKFQDRPKIRARSLVFILLGLPLDVPGVVALAAASLWLITLHMVNLLLGVVRVAFSASWWLAPTPIGLVRYTAAVSHRALAGQLGICALLVSAAYAIKGAPILHTGLVSALGWLGTVCVVSAITCC